MKTFLTFLLEANAVGSKFEQKTADMVNEWLKARKLDGQYKAKRFQSIEEDSARDEDYSDVVVEEIKTGKQFFIECKEADRSNVMNAKLEISEDGGLVLQKDGGEEQIGEDEESLESPFVKAVQESDEYVQFREFMGDGNDFLGSATPADYYFGKKDDADTVLKKLIPKYNKLVKSGKVESDCKPFDQKKLRDSTKGQLVAALCWRLGDPENRTWDICHLDDIPNFGKMIRNHYAAGKEIPAAYIQFNDKLFLIDPQNNPLNLKDVPVFPNDIQGKFALKFTPRFGTGAVYVTPRSEITSELDSGYSFNDKDKWPEVSEKLNEAEEISDNSTYLSNMSKTFGDKAWFIDMIKPEIDTIIDFGGGCGDFCKFIQAKLNRPMKFIIIDNNPAFKSQAEQRGYTVFDSLDSLLSWNNFSPETTLLNMSSVIHEVYSYADPEYDDVGEFWTRIKQCSFKQIAIRDMSMHENTFKSAPIETIKWICDNVLEDPGILIKGKPISELYEDFQEIWGPVYNNITDKVNVKNLIHFLIKYRYVENWQREVQENYLPVSQDRLASILTGAGYSFTHRESSKLEFYGRAWDKDLKLGRPDNNGYRQKFSMWLKTLNTHIKWMLEHR